jgi:hypothetical protein
VIIITIVKNSATTVKAFLTQKEESFHQTVQLKATVVEIRSKKRRSSERTAPRKKGNIRVSRVVDHRCQTNVPYISSNRKGSVNEFHFPNLYPFAIEQNRLDHAVSAQTGELMSSESVCDSLARMSYFLGVSLRNKIGRLSPGNRTGDYHHERKHGGEGANRFHNHLLIQTDLYFCAIRLSSKGYAMETKDGSVLRCLTSGMQLCNAKRKVE